MAEPLEHDQAAADAITAELVACTLGARRRPELRVDVAAVLDRMARRIGAVEVALGEALLPALRRAANAIATFGQAVTREADRERRGRS